MGTGPLLYLVACQYAKTATVSRYIASYANLHGEVGNPGAFQKAAPVAFAAEVVRTTSDLSFEIRRFGIYRHPADRVYRDHDPQLQ